MCAMQNILSMCDLHVCAYMCHTFYACRQGVVWVCRGRGPLPHCPSTSGATGQGWACVRQNRNAGQSSSALHKSGRCVRVGLTAKADMRFTHSIHTFSFHVLLPAHTLTTWTHFFVSPSPLLPFQSKRVRREASDAAAFTSAVRNSAAARQTLQVSSSHLKVPCPCP